MRFEDLWGTERLHKASESSKQIKVSGDIQTRTQKTKPIKPWKSLGQPVVSLRSQ
jgi:hypothetical protein